LERERVKKFNHEGHEEHEGKRSVIRFLIFLNFKSFMLFMVKSSLFLKRRVRDINHEGHEDHEGKRRGLILNFLKLQVLHALHGEKFFVLSENRVSVQRFPVRSSPV